MRQLAILLLLTTSLHAQDTVKLSTIFADKMAVSFLNYPILEHQVSEYKQFIHNDSILYGNIRKDLEMCKTLNNDYKTLTQRDSVDVLNLNKSVAKLIKRRNLWRTLSGVFGLVSIGEAGLIYLMK